MDSTPSPSLGGPSPAPSAGPGPPDTRLPAKPLRTATHPCPAGQRDGRGLCSPLRWPPPPFPPLTPPSHAYRAAVGASLASGAPAGGFPSRDLGFWCLEAAESASTRLSVLSIFRNLVALSHLLSSWVTGGGLSGQSGDKGACSSHHRTTGPPARPLCPSGGSRWDGKERRLGSCSLRRVVGRVH